MRASVRSCFGAALLLALGACSNIIGISEIEIDPSLDGPSEGGTAGKDSGGKSTGGSAGVSTAGDQNGGTAGTSVGGKAGGGSGGSEALGGAGDGSGGEPVTGCRDAKDCDDDIACTKDACVDAKCVHTTDDTACLATACETCVAGIGCVGGPKKTENLLLDGGFDLNEGDWDDESPPDIVADATAPSAPNLLKIGPAAPNANDYLYTDVYQWVTMPERMVALDMEVTYQFAPGNKNVNDEYTVVALYPEGEIDPFTQFHEFKGSDAAQPTWKTVTFSAPAPEVNQMGGMDFSFDFVGNSYDGVYRFDNVKLNATYCE